MYSTHNEGKSVIAERFIRTFKNKIYKYMASKSKTVYNDTLDDIVNEYNNTYHRTIKMKPVDTKNNTYINIDKEVKFTDRKFTVPWTYIISDLNSNRSSAHFMKKNCKLL